MVFWFLVLATDPKRKPRANRRVCNPQVLKAFSLQNAKHPLFLQIAVGCKKQKYAAFCGNLSGKLA
jgi:hypothetical protein